MKIKRPQEETVQKMVSYSWKELNNVHYNLSSATALQGNTVVYICGDKERVTPELLQNLNVICQKRGIGVDEIILNKQNYRNNFSNLFKTIDIRYCTILDVYFNRLYVEPNGVLLITHRNIFLPVVYYFNVVVRKFKQRFSKHTTGAEKAQAQVRELKVQQFIDDKIEYLGEQAISTKLTKLNECMAELEQIKSNKTYLSSPTELSNLITKMSKIMENENNSAEKQE